ncbi:putative transmembrane protein 244 isoform X1 [Lampetra fluviatilis]
MAAVRFSAAPSTTTILLKLVTCLFIFYSAFYTVSSLCLGVFRMDKFDGLMPFDFNEPPSLKPSYIAILISTEVTFLLSGLLFAIVVRGWLWDYAVSVTVVHIITTCIGEWSTGSTTTIIHLITDIHIATITTTTTNHYLKHIITTIITIIHIITTIIHVIYIINTIHIITIIHIITTTNKHPHDLHHHQHRHHHHLCV